MIRRLFIIASGISLLLVLSIISFSIASYWQLTTIDGRWSHYYAAFDITPCVLELTFDHDLVFDLSIPPTIVTERWKRPGQPFRLFGSIRGNVTSFYGIRHESMSGRDLPFPDHILRRSVAGFGFGRLQSWNVDGLASTGCEISIPLVPLLCALLVMPAVLALRINRSLRRRRSGLCVTCGYDLRASIGRCPECGTSIGQCNANNASALLYPGFQTVSDRPPGASQ
jgi:predicted RNA-binding Zn-ribbon protein involved in translation (DUF1610 family)